MTLQTCWIGNVEAIGVVEARIPALSRRPLHRLIESHAIHDTDRQIIGIQVCHVGRGVASRSSLILEWKAGFSFHVAQVSSG